MLVAILIESILIEMLKYRAYDNNSRKHAEPGTISSYGSQSERNYLSIWQNLENRTTIPYY